jgi:hypothetical protein
MTPKVSTKILIGYQVPGGEPVYAEEHHFFISGMTQKAGKTTCVEGILSRWPGQTSIAFITKRGEMPFTNSVHIRPFFRQRADWQYIVSLIDAAMGEKNKMLRTTIMRVCEGATTLEEVHANTKRKLALEKSSFGRDMLYQLDKILDLVVPAIKRYNFASQLEDKGKPLVKGGVYAMDLTGFTSEVRAMIIGAVAEEIELNRDHTALVIPEAWEMLPLNRGSPAKLQVESLIRRGAVNSNYVVLDSQDIAGVYPPIRKQISNWILGKQADENEAVRTIGALPLDKKSKPPVEAIQTLPLGHFYGVFDGSVQRIYARPAWMGEKEAIARAKGMPVTHQNAVTPAMIEEANQKESIEVAPQNDYESGTTSPKLGEIPDLQSKEIDFEDIGKPDPVNDLYNSIQEIVRQVVRMELKADGLIGNSSNNSNSGQIVVQQTRASISINKVRQQINFEEDSVPGRIIRAMQEGKLDAWRSAPKIGKLLESYGPAVDMAEVRDMLEAFTKSPYHLIRMRKNTSDRTFEFQVDKEELAEAMAKK